MGFIASGAYGEVWLGRNAVGTLRAVKIVLRDRHTSKESFEREFKGLQKFEPVSRSHEGLVDILTLGLLPDGAGFYYVMELADDIRGQKGAPADSALGVPGTTFESYHPRTLRADLKSRGALPVDEVIALGLKLSAALARLHTEGLVHRDVKPSNILFIGGEPKLSDAGLVADMDDARSLVGTAGYIAPEGPGAPQADLYALGKVLYESAFGKDRQEFPTLPAGVAFRLDHDQLLELNAILLRACAHDSRVRYQTAEAIRADLKLLEHGKSVTRQRLWQHVSSTAKKVTKALVALGVAGSVAYFTWPKSVSSSEIGWSKNEEANAACRAGWNAYHQNASDSFKTAAGNYERALAIDPVFPRAHARLVSAYVWLNPTDPGGLEKARPHAELALKLEPRLDEAHVAMSTIMVLWTYDWNGAEREARKAIELNPNSDENYYAYAGPLSEVDPIVWTGKRRN